MEKQILLSLNYDEFQNIIVDCVNSCLKHHSNIPSTSEDQYEMFNSREAARFLGISLQTLYGKNSAGELPSCKVPGSKRLYFFKTDLVDYLKSGRQKTNAEISELACQKLNRNV